MGVRRPWSSIAGLVAAGDRHHLELAVLAHHADRGDAEARKLGDTLGDQLEGVTRRPVGPARSRRAGQLCLRDLPRHRCVVTSPWPGRMLRGYTPFGGRVRATPGRRICLEPTAAPRLGSVHQPHQDAQGWRRPADRSPRPPGPGTPGRLRRLRRLGPGRGRRQADLLRPLRPPAPRPGVGRHRGEQRPPDPGLQGHGPGLQVFDETTLASLKGHLAIGHCRYSTTGASTWQNAQPTFRPTADGSIALGHNGNLINTHELHRAGRRPARPRPTSWTCTPAPSRRRPTTPGWSPRCSRTTPTPRWSSGRSRCCRCCAAPSASSG